MSLVIRTPCITLTRWYFSADKVLIPEPDKDKHLFCLQECSVNADLRFGFLIESPRILMPNHWEKKSQGGGWLSIICTFAKFVVL